jgi:hypothetical protein
VKLHQVPFCGVSYRVISRLLHRLNLHYAPAKLMLNNGNPLVSRWCQWCGMRSQERWFPSETVDPAPRRWPFRAVG